MIDLWLLKPIFDDSPDIEEETEIGYQAHMAQAQWFTPLPHQGLEGESLYINREGRRLTQTEVVSIRERKEHLPLVKGEK